MLYRLCAHVAVVAMTSLVRGRSVCSTYVIQPRDACSQRLPSRRHEVHIHTTGPVCLSLHFWYLSLSGSAGNTARLALDDKCSARPVARNPLHRLTCDVQRSLYLETVLCSGHPTACPVTHSGRLTALAHSLQCRGMPCCCIASHIVDSAIAELLHCLCGQTKVC